LLFCGLLCEEPPLAASGAKTHFNFQDEELLLRHDKKVLADYIGFRQRPHESAAKWEGKLCLTHGRVIDWAAP